MKFDNVGMTLYMHSDLNTKKLFEVTHICATIKEANEIMKDNPDIGVISTDDAGRHYLAKLDSDKLSVK